VDERIGELEAIANPTVGLAAHNGIIDIRITAKAGSEKEADRMIGEIEAIIRQRIGPDLFGADDDTLEGTALESVTRKGWKLFLVEVGLGEALTGRVARLGSPVVAGSLVLEQTTVPLRERVDTVLASRQADIVLAVQYHATNDGQAVTILLANPDDIQEKMLSYGGHPGNAPLWAANMALDLLRRAVGI
jgi:hypothetical protein